MVQEGFKRKLTAILSADVVGYSRLMEDNEEATIQTLNTYRNSMSTLIQQHRGRVVDTTGDNLMAEFSSVVDAVKCAVETQKEMSERNADLPEKRRMTLAAIIVLLTGFGGLAGWYLYHEQSKQVEPASIKKMAYPLPDKPSIAVLPFDNMSEDPKQEYFSDGITEEIITALSKIPKLFVIARNSTFTYKGKPVKVKQVAEELGVRYVLEGSIRKAGDKIRITAQLIDSILIIYFQ